MFGRLFRTGNNSETRLVNNALLRSLLGVSWMPLKHLDEIWQIAGDNPAMVVGHMVDDSTRMTPDEYRKYQDTQELPTYITSAGEVKEKKTPRFPVVYFWTALVGMWIVLFIEHMKRPFTSVITGGTHGGDTIGEMFARLFGIPLIIIRPYGDNDHIEARIPYTSENELLIRFSEIFEHAFQRSVKTGKTQVFYPRVDLNAIKAQMPDLFEAMIELGYVDFLESHDMIPSQEIAEQLGSSIFENPYLCYELTNSTMLAFLAQGIAGGRKLFALWNGDGGDEGKSGGTAHAVATSGENFILAKTFIVNTGLFMPSVKYHKNFKGMVVETSHLLQSELL